MTGEGFPCDPIRRPHEGHKRPGPAREGMLVVRCGDLLRGSPAGRCVPGPDSGPEKCRQRSARVDGQQRVPAEEHHIPLENPQQWLRAVQVDDSQFAIVTDGRPVDEAEEELLWKLLYWIDRLPLVYVERWIDRRWSMDQLAKDPAGQRGRLLELRGRVQSVEPLVPPPEVAQRLELPRYYRCRFILEPTNQPAVVYATTVPEQWEDGATPDEPGAAAGLFLKLSGSNPAEPRPVVAAARIAWYPNNLLGRLRMDVGLLDDVRPRGPIRAEEREAFYQLLAAAGRSAPGELLREARRVLAAAGKEAYSVVPLFNEPETQTGRLVCFTGTARQVIRVVVDDPDIRARFGIDHYYHVGVVTEESAPHPIYFCVLEVPEGMPRGTGPDFGEQVTVAGFFFKKWFYRPKGKYRNLPDPNAPEVKYQPAPLMIGRDLIWHPRPKASSNTLAAAIAGGLFVVAVAGIWLAVWYCGRKDRQFERTTVARTLLGEDRLRLEELDGGPESPPALSDKGGEPDETTAAG